VKSNQNQDEQQVLLSQSIQKFSREKTKTLIHFIPIWDDGSKKWHLEYEFQMPLSSIKN